MISGNALIECGTGSVVGTYTVNNITGAGLVAMRSCLPGPIDTREVEPGEFESIMSSAEVLICFNNIESLDSVIGTLTKLREMMVEERERLNKECRDELVWARNGCVGPCDCSVDVDI